MWHDEGMIRKSKGQIQWLEFELLAECPNLVHGVFLRHGGVSQHHCSSLNASFKNTGDCSHQVEENQKRMKEALGLKKLVVTDAIHHTHIQLVNDCKAIVTDCDGLMTNQHSLALMATHADCQAAILYDPIHHAVANVHAGWRGQVKNIYREAISKMQQAFNTNPKEVLVGISPSLGPNSAEFKNFKDEFPKEFWSFQVKPAYFDLWAIARHQLESCGILSHHIQVAEIDTFAHPEDFFSYRRECKVSGRKEQVTGCHGTLAALKT